MAGPFVVGGFRFEQEVWEVSTLLAHGTHGNSHRGSPGRQVEAPAGRSVVTEGNEEN